MLLLKEKRRKVSHSRAATFNGKSGDPQVTAVRSDNGGRVINWAGTVNIAEDTTQPNYTSIYSQNISYGAKLPPSVVIESGSNGLGTFTAQSLAQPAGLGARGAPPESALIRSTNYPIYGSSFPIAQWVVSGYPINPIDPRATTLCGSLPVTTGSNSLCLPAYDWVQTKALDLFLAASKGSDLDTVLSSAESYSIAVLSDGGGGFTTFVHGARAATITISPFFNEARTDSPTYSVCGNSRSKYFTNTLYHESRHAYQGLHASSNNDADQDFLIKPGTDGVAPTDTLVDSTAPRAGCNVDANPPLPATLTFMGDQSFDSYKGNVRYAIEQDAYLFAAIWTPLN
jgi:hypothetical protein